MVSFENFKMFVQLFVQQFNACFTWLNSISIAGLTMFQWILGFMAAGSIFVIIRAFAGVGGVSISSVGSGAAEQIRMGQAEGRRKAEVRARKSEREAEHAARQAERETYDYYKRNRSRSEAYSARYQKEKGGK